MRNLSLVEKSALSGATNYKMIFFFLMKSIYFLFLHENIYYMYLIASYWNSEAIPVCPYMFF